MRKKGVPILLILSLSLLFAIPVFSNEAVRNDTSLVDVNRAFLEEKQNTTLWKRDPFILPVRPAGQAALSSLESEIGKPLLSLSAIIYREGDGAAIVNHRILRQGDQIEGMVVQEILSDRVILREGSKTMELKVDQFLTK